MIDLEKIKREVDDVCQSIRNAYISLGNKSKEYDEGMRQLDQVKTDIALLKDAKANFAIDVRNERDAAAVKKKEYTAGKNKYRNLMDKLKLDHQELLGKHQAEIDAMRTEGMSLLKSEQARIVSDNKIFKEETCIIKTEYADYKEKLRKLKEGIPD